MIRLRNLVGKSSKPTEKDAAEAAHAEHLNRRVAQVLNRAKARSETPERTVETRQEERFVPHHTATSFTLPNGKRYDARIMNLSKYAVAIDADFSAVAVEDITHVGKHAVTHVRMLRPGAVFKFKTPLEEKQCNTAIML